MIPTYVSTELPEEHKRYGIELLRDQLDTAIPALDLTIPPSICSELDIRVGDVFDTIPKVCEGKIKLEYIKAYKYREQ